MNKTVAAKPKRNLWPWAIAIYFVLFISFITVFITWAVRQNMDLVRKDYYSDEILFQKQIDAETRTRTLGAQAAIRYDEARRGITIQLPIGQAAHHPVGRIDLYRPSDAKLDREVNLATDVNGAQYVDATALRSGLWNVRLRWKVAGQDFYCRQNVVIGD